jgi:replication-associated recombination protein RarA
MGENAQPRLCETIRELLGVGDSKMLAAMGQHAVDELAKMLLDTKEGMGHRHSAADALGDILSEHGTLDARKGLAALRWVARHERKENMELIEEAVSAFRQVTGSYPSQCNGYEYRNDRD